MSVRLRKKRLHISKNLKQRRWTRRRRKELEEWLKLGGDECEGFIEFGKDSNREMKYA